MACMNSEVVILVVAWPVRLVLDVTSTHARMTSEMVILDGAWCLSTIHDRKKCVLSILSVRACFAVSI